MSVQNLLEPNNLELFVGTMNADNLLVQELAVTSDTVLNDVTVNDLIVLGTETSRDIIPDLDNARSLGSGSRQYETLHAYNVVFAGVSTPLNKYYSISSSSNISGAYVVANGFNYEGTVIGNIVNLIFSLPQAAATAALPITAGAINVNIRPSSTITALIPIQTGAATITTGLIRIASSGVVDIYPSADAASVFTIANIIGTPLGYGSFSISYNI